MTTAYPLAWPDGWPRTTRRTHHQQFRAPFDKSRSLLLGELRRLGSPSCVISSNLQLGRDGHARVDRASANLDDPGVAVYFQRKGRPMVMAQDRFLTPMDNLRAIYLAVQAMRTLERHGGGHMMERAFGGFAQLPPPEGAAAPAERPWREVFAPLPDGLAKADLLLIVEARYRAAARHHPDRRMGRLQPGSLVLAPGRDPPRRLACADRRPPGPVRDRRRIATGGRPMITPDVPTPATERERLGLLAMATWNGVPPDHPAMLAEWNRTDIDHTKAAWLRVVDAVAAAIAAAPRHEASG